MATFTTMRIRWCVRSSQIRIEIHPRLCILDAHLHVAHLQDAPLAVALAALPQLSALNLGHTAAGDATLAALTYAHRAAAWSREHGVLRVDESTTQMRTAHTLAACLVMLFRA
jgi:hypothetical protein